MAKILPLDGKYYGTCIELDGPKGDGSTIDVWLSTYSPASEREYAQGWCPDDGYDHVESQYSFDVATIICNALTKEGY